MFTRATRTTVGVLGSAIDALSWDDALGRIARWASESQSRYVCACNVHSLVTASLDPAFRDTINSADMAVPDGMPIVWSLNKLGFPQQRRISGPDLMSRLCADAAACGVKIFLYGSSPRTLTKLQANLTRRIPGLRIVGAHSPPYRNASEEEDREVVDMINDSGAAIVFIGLGCPKQERWMAQHRGRIHAVMIGVGAAFDYHAGTLKRAPVWMQNGGLEWAYRLAHEPRRLWRRYLKTNLIFSLRIARQFVKEHQRAARDMESALRRLSTERLSSSADAPEIEEPIR